MGENVLAGLVGLFYGTLLGAILCALFKFGVADYFHPLGRAKRARRKKWEGLCIEYLSYGFSEHEAEAKADAKMKTDAQNTEETV